MDPVLEAMVAAARAGGAVALEHFRRGVDVTLKADRSPVTIADAESERVILATLARACPEHGVLAESRARVAPRPAGSSSIPSTARGTSRAASRTGPC